MTAVDSQLLDVDGLLLGEVGDLSRRWQDLGEEELRHEIERYRNAIMSMGSQLTQLGVWVCESGGKEEDEDGSVYSYFGWPNGATPAVRNEPGTTHELPCTARPPDLQLQEWVSTLILPRSWKGAMPRKQPRQKTLEPWWRTWILQSGR